MTFEQEDLLTEVHCIYPCKNRTDRGKFLGKEMVDEIAEAFGISNNRDGSVGKRGHKVLD